MCLAAWAIDQTRAFPLVLVANRDEYFERPAARLAWWQDRPDRPPILGGRDLHQGGTWFGLTTAGRLAPLYRFGEGVIDGHAVQVSAQSVRLPGFAQPVRFDDDLPLP